ncbi:putative ribonuclease H-like domain-containing protein [Tanacetum coccineum]
MSSMGELTFFLGLQVKQKDDGIFISQDKYVADILKKFDFATGKTTSTPIETNKALLKDEEAADVDVHLYRSMIGSLMYLTASRPNIMFAVCACARDSPFDLEAFSDSDYANASLDRKSTTGGCQFLRRRLISWQCKKQTIVANSTTEAEYVATANCCGQVLLIQNQLLDYGYNFMNTKVFIDSESTICIVTNPVFHSTTKHIKIRHHFIRDSYEKRLIQVIKIHTDHNVADLLTKAFDVIRFQYLIANETVHKERGDSVERAATTATSLDAKHGSVNTLGSEKDSMKLQELMDLCTKLFDKVLNLENVKELRSIGILKKRSHQGWYATLIRKINTTSTSITTASINITNVKPVTTASAPITTAGVIFSTSWSAAVTPPTTNKQTTSIEDERPH